MPMFCSGSTCQAVLPVKKPDGSWDTIYLDSGKNPPNGVVVQYFLPEKSAPVSLAFGTGKGERESLFITNLGISGTVVPALPWAGPGLLKIEVGIPGMPLPVR